MKKFYSFALAFITLFACVFFASCGSKYKNLKMEFVNTDGEAITEINLMLDDQNENALDEVELGVKISGVKSNDVGDVSISCPQKKVDIPKNEISYSGGTFRFTAHALASGSGEIVIKHLASNKTAKLNLFVDQKSNNLTANDNRYIISIPESASKIVSFNPNSTDENNIAKFVSDLYSLSPKSSTDSVYFALPQNGNASLTQQVNRGNVSVNTRIINDQSVIESLVVNSTATDIEFEVYPVAVMNGYSNTTYDEQPITIVLKRVLTNENLLVKTDDYHQPYLDNGQTIILIANDNSAENVVNADGGVWNYEYNYLPIELAGLFGGNAISLTDNHYYDYYNLSVRADNVNINCNDANLNRILISAMGNVSTPRVKVTLNLTSKNCVGDIFEVSKEIYVKAEVKPETIVTYMQGRRLSLGETPELFDYYYGHEGELFEFFAYTNSQNDAGMGLEPFADMTKMHIMIDPAVLNAYENLEGNLGGQHVGEMPIYSDASFGPNEQITNLNSIANVRTSKYLFDFYVNDNRPLRFYYDQSTAKFVSENFDKNTDLYIKYVNNQSSNANTDTAFAFSVENVYTGNLEYLKNIKGCQEVTTTFVPSLGVESATVFAGQLTDDNGINMLKYGEELAAGKDIHINRKAYSNSNENMGAYTLFFDEVLGISRVGENNPLDNATFNVSINPLKVWGENVDPLLKLNKYSNDGNLGTEQQGEAEINFEYVEYSTVSEADRQNHYKNNALVLIFNEHTQIGDYQIVIKHVNGYQKTIVVHVYEDLTEDNLHLVYNLAGLDVFAYVNKDATTGEFRFEGFDADFIVATNAATSGVGRNYQFALNVDDAVLQSGIVNFYDYKASLSADGEIEEFLSIKTDADKRNANTANLIFKRGTYNTTTNENNYITIDFEVVVDNFVNLFEVDGDNAQKKVSISKTFFVFEPINESDMTLLNVPTTDRYSENAVGIYYEDRAELNLKLEIDENLKNYIQADQQSMRFGQTELNKFDVVWESSVANIYRFISQSDYEIRANFAGANIDPQPVEIKATIKQFGRTISKICIVHLAKANLTDRVEILNLTDAAGNKKFINVNVAEQNYYIDLKQNDELTINATTISNSGNLTFGENNLIFVVVDRAGNKSTDAIQLEGNKLSVLSMAKNIRLIAFAKDALDARVEELSSIPNPELLLKQNHENAYFEINIILSDGKSMDNPFIINDAADFWEIKDGDSAYYRLMENININTQETDKTGALKHKPIENFAGHIDTYSYTEQIGSEQVEITVVYTISGINLNDRFINLFKNFSGSISNVNFDVVYNYSSASGNLGLIDKVTNSGALTNVTLNVNGSANLNAGAAYFGALAGENLGTIIYTSNDVVGASGSIELGGSAEVMFGGLIGHNVGVISGYNADTEKVLLNSKFALIDNADTNIVFSVMLGDSGAMASLDISAQNLTNSASAVGGIVGLNEGKIKDAYATGRIAAGCMAGGIIGKNNTEILTININNSNENTGTYNEITEITPNSGDRFSLQHLTSSVVISGADYVGGIVGYDDGGSYYYCQTQILLGDEVAISGAKYVGGIAGYSRYGTFSFCSVMSYRWDYNDLSTINSGDVVDIYGTDYVGGIVGLAESAMQNLENGLHSYNVSVSSRLTTVMFSSVNALLAVENDGAIYGILNSNNSETHSVIYNAYFIGKLAKLNDGIISDVILTEEGGAALATSDANAIYNYVYSINAINDDDPQIAKYSNAADSEFELNTPPNLHWAISQNEAGVGNLNGGYIYITEDGANSIFVASPTNVNAQVISPVLTGKTMLLRLYYYDFMLDSANENYRATISALNKKFNRYRILAGAGETGLLNFTVEPKISGVVRLIAESSNSSVVSIDDNYLVVNGLGDNCTLTFYSSLNPHARCTIDVIVVAPIGDDFVLSSSAADRSMSIDGTTQNIAKGKTKDYYSIASASKEFLFNGSENFPYRTSNDVYLEVTVTKENAPEFEGTIGDYISISGQTPNEGEDTSNSLKVLLNPQTNFSITVKKHLENGTFKVNVKPLTKITYQGETFDIPEQNGTGEKQIEFSVKTYQGPTAINLSCEQIIIYPNESADVFVYISTDLKLEQTDLECEVQLRGETIQPADLNKYIEFVGNSDLDTANSLQTLRYKVKYNDDIQIDEEELMTIRFSINNLFGGATLFDSITFKLEPQRIDNIEIKNYVYQYTPSGAIDTDENGVAKIEPSDMLRPIGYGLMILNMSPINGYYNYLEIVDLNASGYDSIIFTQIDGINGARLDRMDIVTADGRGIKLNKLNGSSPLYVSTQIDSRATSRLHTVRVSAFDEFGNFIISNQITIDIKMLPEIEMEYVDPNGVHFDGGNGNLYLANGVPADLAVTTKNSDGDVNITGTISGGLEFDNYFEIEQTRSGYRLVGRYSEDLINKTLTLTATTTLTLNNGTTETEEATLNFKIAEYAIHNVSVNSSTVNFGATEQETTRAIHGDFGVPTVLNFYFRNFDLSLLEANGTYWSNTYTYNPTMQSDGSALASINNILAAINTTTYLTLGKIVDGRFAQLTNQDKDEEGHYEASLTYDSDSHKVHLLVNSNKNNNLALRLRFNLKLNADGMWEVVAASNNTNELQFDYKYILNFANATSFLEPEVVKNEADFLNMVNYPNRNYILGNDLVLEDYTPIDVNLLSFDGNGRKIIIKSFAEFDEAEIYVGLFRQIYENMLVSNLEVVYLMDNADENSPLGRINTSNPANSTFKDLCTNETVAYTGAYFGGLTPENNGIITNCQVSGGVALRVSTLENQRTINFNMGGLVCNNSGYITNSDSRLAMVGKANIGGLVHTNTGKIASSSYLAEGEFRLNNDVIRYSQEKSGVQTLNINRSGFIFAFENNASVEVGGLAVYNQPNAIADFNEISMCNVVVGGQAASNITAQNGSVGGFVYSNTGKIYNCYTNYSVFGESGHFAGFVATGGGQIDLCYAYVNKGVLSSREAYSLFTSKTAGATGITNSYEIVDLTSTSLEKYLRDNKVDGVNYIRYEDRLTKSSYANFMFGDGSNGVWQILPGEMPTLTSVGKKVVVNSVRASTESIFYGLRTIVREEIKLELDNQIQTTYKYVLMDNGYGTSANPIILYNLESWNYYLTDGTTKYFRLVANIDFNNVRDNPSTSTRTFSGNMQGNNMLIDNIIISSSNNLTSIGLFKDLIASGDITTPSVVANLKLNSSRYTAAQTQAVGILAGIIEDYKIYNIQLSSNDYVLLGANAVGGLAGVVRGNFDLDGITSSVNVNAESKSGSKYNVYMSVNNGVTKSYNLSNVHYAGSVAGILDGYLNSSFDINAERNLNNAYINATNINVNSRVTVIGDLAGAMFGFVGERVKVSNLKLNMENGNIEGKYYSSALVGENRGIIEGAVVDVAEDVNIFASSRVLSGLVGLNLGGLVIDSSARIDIINQSTNSTVGGLVGRSVNGFIKNSTFSGKLFGQFTGGIVGSNLDKEVFTTITSTSGSLDASCISNGMADRLVPNSDLKYFDVDNSTGLSQSVSIKQLDNVGISENSVKYWMDNLTMFYSYRTDRDDVYSALTYSHALGLAVGAEQSASAEAASYIENYGYDGEQKQIVFNGTPDIDLVGMVENATLQNGAQFNTPFANVINSIPGVSGTRIMYVVGVNISALDSWARDKYSNDIVIITNETVNELKLFAVDDELTKSDSKLKFYISYDNNTENPHYEVLPKQALPNTSSYYALEFNYGFIENVSKKDVSIEAKYKDEDGVMLVAFNNITNFEIVFTSGETKIQFQFNLTN